MYLRCFFVRTLQANRLGDTYDKIDAASIRQKFFKLLLNLCHTIRYVLFCTVSDDTEIDTRHRLAFCAPRYGTRWNESAAFVFCAVGFVKVNRKTSH